MYEARHVKTEFKQLRKEDVSTEFIQNSPTFGVAIDRQGQVIFMNKMMLDALGYEEREVVGQNYISKFIPEREHDLLDATFEKHLLRKESTIEENAVLSKDGREFLVEWHGRPIVDEKDDYLYHLGIGIDITERKMMEDRIKRLETMEVLGRVAGGVAHDLNNVLGVMVGYSGVLIDQMDAHHPVKKSLQMIMDSGQRATAIVQDLLIMTRRGVVVREPVNLNKIISHYLYSPEFITLAGLHEGIHLETDMESTLMNISGSDIHLQRTIMNLTINAMEATPKGGSVTIKTENCYLDVPVRGYEEIGRGEYAVLSISDTGGGISSEHIRHIFEPFYTTKQMKMNSSGLGLSVVWGVVKDLDGYVDVQSKKGEGTTFKLYFPVTREDLPKAIIDMIAARCTGHNESILVVDDEKGQCELATMILSRVNYDVMSVSSGEEAVEYLKSHKADLVILDMLMEPGMDGLDTYREIIKIHPGQKAIIVSGFAETERTMEAQRLGAGAFVRKPYLAKRLGMEVRRELNRK